MTQKGQLPAVEFCPSPRRRKQDSTESHLQEALLELRLAGTRVEVRLAPEKAEERLEKVIDPLVLMRKVEVHGVEAIIVCGRHCPLLAWVDTAARLFLVQLLYFVWVFLLSPFFSKAVTFAEETTRSLLLLFSMDQYVELLCRALVELFR